MTLTEKLLGLYEGICELSMLLKMPVIAGLALGVSYAAAVSIKHIEDAAFFVNPPAQKVIQRTYDLEGALNETLERVETCGSNDDPNRRRDVRIVKGDGYIVGECLDSDGSARVWVGDEGLSFSCYGERCPERVNLTFNEYVPRCGASPKVTRTFRRTDFALTDYKYSDAPEGGAFEVHAPHPTLRDEMAVYGAMLKTHGIQVAADQARTRLSQL